MIEVDKQFRTVPQPPPPPLTEEVITISLNISEATMLKRVLGRIAGGGPIGDVCRKINSGLHAQGINYEFRTQGAIFNDTSLRINGNAPIPEVTK